MTIPSHTHHAEEQGSERYQVPAICERERDSDMYVPQSGEEERMCVCLRCLEKRTVLRAGHVLGGKVIFSS